MKMHKKLLALSMAILMTASLAACGGGSGSSTADGGTDAPAADSSSEASADTTKLAEEVETDNEFEMWAFVELHGQFYADMLKRWNEENPEEQLNINFVVMPYDDMHNKYTLALQSGEGIPDFCDIEIGKFPNYLQGEPQLADLTSYAEPYRGEVVESRLEIYSKDGKLYGIPTHVGAVVAFYNTEILEGAGVDYTTIKTWDDYKEAGLKVKDSGHIMGISETNNSQMLDIMLVEQGSDKTLEDGTPNLDTPEALKALTLLREFNTLGIDQTIPGRHPDTEEGWGALNAGEYATVIRPLWMMSRYTNYMDNLDGKIALAPAPTFEGSEIVSFGGGGTGTVISKDCPNIDLAGRWLTYAKLSKIANEQIWNVLGFDPVNTSLWDDEALTHNPDNMYVKYFQTNPFDVLKEIEPKMGIVKSTSGVPAVNNIWGTVTSEELFNTDKPIEDLLKEAQEQAMNELGL